MPQCYAIVPAAGRSRRMGAPKLLLPWPTRERPCGLLIDQVLAAWTASLVSRVVVVVRRDDQPLIDACRRWKVDLLTPEQPPSDMTASIQIGLQHLESVSAPSENAGCFIAPSDLPSLQPRVVDGLWQYALRQWPEAERQLQCVWTPTFGDKSGHPALLPWPACKGIFDLPSGTGVDSHVRQLQRRLVAFPESLIVDDCDTPEEYQRALKQFNPNG